MLALISVVLLGTTSGLIALDTIDQWTNNIGIVASAIVMTIVVIWVKRRGGELSRHLERGVPTFKVGGLWLFFTGVIGPIVLIWMLAAKVIDLVTGGYEGYATWYLGVARVGQHRSRRRRGDRAADRLVATRPAQLRSVADE